jgi:transcriptional regulator with XRE-family HTH domain
MSKKSPNPIDVAVGNRIRTRRMALGLSQEKLGETLDITFQQIQKYEKGTNRVSASKLQLIAGILKVPVSYFFEDQAQADHVEMPGERLSAVQMNVVSLMAAMTPEAQASMLSVAKAIVNASPMVDHRTLADLPSAAE